MSSLPTIAVYVLLGAVGWWGHHSGWKLASFKSLAGQDAAEPEEWCAAHNVSEAKCIACDSEILPAGPDFGWCHDHGLHQCPLCHPDIVQTNEPVELPADYAKRVSLALRLRKRPENNVGCPLYRNRLQFVDAAAVEKAGIDVEPVQTERVVESLTANGEITYDETQLARLTPRVMGFVTKVLKNVGDPVREGELVALIDSAEVGRLKGTLLEALAQLDLERDIFQRIAPLARDNVVAGQELITVQKAVEQAKIRVVQTAQALNNLGFDTSIVSELTAQTANQRADLLRYLGIPAELRPKIQTNNLLPVFATLDGVVTKREVVSGEVVETSDLLFEFANTGRMWLTLQVLEEDAHLIDIGQAVSFRPEGFDVPIAGTLSWISTNIDPQTRTVSVRAVVDNADGRLRSESFGTGEIILRDEPEAIVVPSAAIQWDGNCLVAFVRDKDYFQDDVHKVFHVRPVRVGVRTEETTEVIVGLVPGEVVVTDGSGVLRSQLLKNNLVRRMHLRTLSDMKLWSVTKLWSGLPTRPLTLLVLPMVRMC